MPDKSHAPMTNRYLDDLAVSDHWVGHPIAVEQDAAIAFARQYDPQPMHTDPAVAAQGRFGGVIASGWYVAALVMRDYVETNPWGGTQALGIGVDELRWLYPVRPGDVLTARREIVELKISRSKPDRGTVRIRTSVSNQDGRDVMTFSTLIQLPTRPAQDR
jgi:acyl dehydratase